MKNSDYTELYQRVEHVAKTLAGSVPQLAKALGKEYRTFKGYLNAKRQDNLWPLLPSLMEIYPRLSRHWLYFAEGPMMLGRGIPLGKPIPLRTLVGIVEEIAKDAGGDYRDLLEHILGLPHDMKESSMSDDAEARIRELEQKLAESQAELLGATKRIIALQDEIMTMRQGQPEGIVFSSGAGPSPAPTTPGAARLSRPDNDPIK